MKNVCKILPLVACAMWLTSCFSVVEPEIDPITPSETEKAKSSSSSKENAESSSSAKQSSSSKEKAESSSAAKQSSSSKIASSSSVAALSSSTPAEEPVSSSSAPLSVNVNANASDDPAAARLEIPHLDNSSFFAAHWVEFEGKKVMNLAIEWNSAIRHANWSAFSWDSLTSLNGTTRDEDWRWDPLVPTELGQVKEADHKSDGFDKGHLVASADRHFSVEANNQTFYYTNISPQISSFNQKFWAQLESKLQKWGELTQTGVYDTIYVVKGGNTQLPLIDFTGTKAASDKVKPYTDSKGFSKGGMLVPSYYFAALLALKDGKYSAIAFNVPHLETLPTKPTVADFQQYVVTIDELEAATGVDFFCNLPDDVEKSVEANVDMAAWNW